MFFFLLLASNITQMNLKLRGSDEKGPITCTTTSLQRYISHFRDVYFIV
jgi:hypothetical protein